MNRAIKKKWVAALRSGEYTQGKGKLRINRDGGETLFCCLGVLCNIHAQEHPKIAATQTDPTTYLLAYDVLPVVVRDWAGLVRCGGDKILIAGEYHSLSHHNDDGCTFTQIADAIEKHL